MKQELYDEIEAVLVKHGITSLGGLYYNSIKAIQDFKEFDFKAFDAKEAKWLELNPEPPYATEDERKAWVDWFNRKRTEVGIRPHLSDFEDDSYDGPESIEDIKEGFWYSSRC